MKGSSERGKILQIIFLVFFALYFFVSVLFFVYLYYVNKKQSEKIDRVFSEIILKEEEISYLSREIVDDLMDKEKILKKIFNRVLELEKTQSISENNKKNFLIYADIELEQKEQEGYRLLKEKKYGQAYEVYKDIIEIVPERLSSRYYGVYSLFYSNEMNRENYSYIIEEIEYLKSQGMDIGLLRGIEDFIKRERDLGHE